MKPQSKVHGDARRAFWQGRSVMVTGATGLIGSWLVRELLSVGARVVAFVRDPDPQSDFYRSGDWQRTTIVMGRLEELASLERAIAVHDVDTVFHLAAQTIVGVANRAPLLTFEANIRGSYHLLEACRRNSVSVKRVVVASSDKAYGTKTTLPYTEEMALEGEHPYDVSKSCTDLLAHTYYCTFGLPVGIARCGNVYGGGDLNWSRIVPDTIRCCLKQQTLVIRSDGTFVRDYVYVKDIARAYLHLAERLDDVRIQGQAFNFACGKPLSVLELVARIKQLLGCELEVKILGQARGEIVAQYLDSSKAREQLNWAPAYDLDEGLTETIAWYRDYQATYWGGS